MRARKLARKLSGVVLLKGTGWSRALFRYVGFHAMAGQRKGPRLNADCITLILMRLRFGCTFFLIGFLLNPPPNCCAQDAQIQIQTLRCDAGIRFHPTAVSVAAFDASRIPEILNAYRQLQPTLDKLNDGPDAIEAADKLTSRLKKLISSTPALVRRRSLPERHLDFPFLGRVEL